MVIVAVVASLHVRRKMPVFSNTGIYLRPLPTDVNPMITDHIVYVKRALKREGEVDETYEGSHLISDTLGVFVGWYASGRLI